MLILKQTEGGDDGGLRDICPMYQDLMVALAQVHLGEEAAARHPGGEIHHIG